MVAGLGLLTTACTNREMKKYTANQSKEDGFVAAAAEGNLTAINQFLATGLDVNVRNKHDTTAVMDAAAGGHPDVVDALLAKGGDANSHGGRGGSGLHARGQKGQAAVV